MDVYIGFTSPAIQALSCVALLLLAAVVSRTGKESMDVNSVLATASHPTSLLLFGAAVAWFSEKHRNLFSLMMIMFGVKAIDALANHFVTFSGWVFYPFYTMLDLLMIVAIIKREQLLKAIHAPVLFRRMFVEYVFVAIYAASAIYNVPTFIEHCFRNVAQLNAWAAEMGFERPLWFYTNLVPVKTALSTVEMVVMIVLVLQAVAMILAARKGEQG